MIKPVVVLVRDMLNDLTPLKEDCGALCGAACCQSEGSDNQGMLLFPTEAELYTDCDFAHIAPLPFMDIDGAQMLICDGHCPRENRPLCCRIFPLAPAWDGTKYRAIIDRRAFSMCPLAGYGVKSFDRAFAASVSKVFNVLSEDEQCRRYIDAWALLMRQLRSIF